MSAEWNPTAIPPPWEQMISEIGWIKQPDGSYVHADGSGDAMTPEEARQDRHDYETKRVEMMVHFRKE